MNGDRALSNELLSKIRIPATRLYENEHEDQNKENLRTNSSVENQFGLIDLKLSTGGFNGTFQNDRVSQDLRLASEYQQVKPPVLQI